jgi:hypothetical protein
MRVVAALGSLHLKTRRDHHRSISTVSVRSRSLGRICAITAALSAIRCSTLFIVKRLSQRLTVRGVGPTPVPERSAAAADR